MNKVELTRGEVNMLLWGLRERIKIVLRTGDVQLADKYQELYNCLDAAYDLMGSEAWVIFDHA